MKKTAILLVCGLTVSSLFGCVPEYSTSGNASISVQTIAPATEYQKVTIYLPDAQAQTFTEQQVQIEKNDEPMVELVQALVTEKALPMGTEVEKWSVSKDDAPAVVLDLNEAFAEGLLATGTTGETMMLGSLINTIWAYFKPASLTITADGEPLETGHNIYDKPFTAPVVLSQAQTTDETAQNENT